MAAPPAASSRTASVCSGLAGRPLPVLTGPEAATRLMSRACLLETLRRCSGIFQVISPSFHQSVSTPPPTCKERPEPFNSRKTTITSKQSTPKHLVNHTLPLVSKASKETDARDAGHVPTFFPPSLSPSLPLTLPPFLLRSSVVLHEQCWQLHTRCLGPSVCTGGSWEGGEREKQESQEKRERQERRET